MASMFRKVIPHYLQFFFSTHNLLYSHASVYRVTDAILTSLIVQSQPQNVNFSQEVLVTLTNDMLINEMLERCRHLSRALSAYAWLVWAELCLCG